MLKTATSSRIQLVASSPSASRPADQVIRRFRLARVRLEPRPAEVLRARRPSRA